MFWSILAIVIVLALAWLFKKGCEGTPFANHSPGAPNINHLRGSEKSETPPGGKPPDKL